MVYIICNILSKWYFPSKLRVNCGNIFGNLIPDSCYSSHSSFSNPPRVGDVGMEDTGFSHHWCGPPKAV